MPHAAGTSPCRVAGETWDASVPYLLRLSDPPRLSQTRTLLSDTPLGPWSAPRSSLEAAATGVGRGVYSEGRLGPGRRVGRYRLIEPLGYGAQGVVWRAVQMEPIVREVALKILTTSQSNCHRRVARLRREAERGMRLLDSAILPTYEHGSADGLIYMAMPVAGACTLQDVIHGRASRGEGPGAGHPLCRLAPGDYTRAVLRVLVRISRALHVAHEAQVVHRDVKPANILLDGEDPERGYLIDFGLARDLDVATLAQLRDGAGTPLYMAPEKLLGLHVDERRCDIYALGASAFEAVTLRPPVDVPRDLSGISLLAYLILHRPAPLPVFCPSMDLELQAILRKALDPIPERRHASARELADELESCAV